MILSSVETGNDTEAIRPFMENIHQTLSEFVSICPFEAARDVLTHYEVLQCSRSLVVLYSEEVLDRMMDLCRESQPAGIFRGEWCASNGRGYSGTRGTANISSFAVTEG
ncbi:uncharacterized protein LOC143900009 isoform X1 [Temnothorax americanus]|uniref:uncharacterized protein LOC143900009 isoform X1 n=1 Tax=Temnothorax americanus TaxID=1964332 RepID=UPI004068B4A4